MKRMQLCAWQVRNRSFHKERDIDGQPEVNKASLLYKNTPSPDKTLLLYKQKARVAENK